MSLPINFDLRNLYTPNTPEAQYPEIHLDLSVLRDALNNFAGLFSTAIQVQNGDATTNWVTIGRNNQGTTQPALELTRSTDVNGYTTLEFANASGTRQLEILSCGTTGGYGIPANQAGINGVAGLTLSTADAARVQIDAAGVVSVLNRLDLTPISTGSLNGIFTRGADTNFQLWAVGNDGTNTTGSRVGTFALYYALGSLFNAGFNFYRGGGATDGELAVAAGGVDRIRVKAAGQLRFIPLTADPAGLQDGDIWYNSTTGTFRGRAGGVTVNL